MWSVRLQILGLAMLGIFLEFPDAALAIWMALPGDLKSLLPPDFVKCLGYGIIIAGTIARIFRQRKLADRKAALGSESQPEIPRPHHVDG